MRYIVISMVFLLLTVMPTLAQTAAPVACGNIIEGEFLQDAQRQDYAIDLSGGDSIRVSIIPLGPTLETTIQFRGPTGQEVDRSHVARAVDLMPSIEPPVLAASGTYTIMVGNSQIESDGDLSTQPWDLGGVGIYTLYIGCTLRDGTVIEPGDVVEVPATETAPVVPTCTGSCFVGLPLVDLSDGIEIPIQLSQPQTATIGGDLVVLYTYDATADSTATLSLSRVGGDISVGVSVIQRDTNAIVFVGGMPSSNNLSVELTFPSDGTYVIGLFRMDTAEKVDTSGAVQVMIE